MNRDRRQVGLLSNAASKISAMRKRSDAIDLLVGDCNEIAINHGWWDTKRGTPEILALIHSEVSECLEAYRGGNPISEKIAPFSCEEEELADILIRVFDYAGHRGFDLGKALVAKMKYNEGRSYRHGGKEA